MCRTTIVSRMAITMIAATFAVGAHDHSSAISTGPDATDPQQTRTLLSDGDR
jgi:hypothetical protein